MTRTKIRNYATVDQVREIINNYFNQHKAEVVDFTLNTLGYDNIEDLWNDEYYGKFGLDCGWVWLTTKNHAQQREWVLDNGKYDAYVTCINFPYNTQSTTIKKIQMEYALNKLELVDQYEVYVRLD